MSKLLAGLWAILAGMVAGSLTVPAAMWVSVATDTCDKTKHVCDLAPMAGFGLGLLAAPFTAICAGIVLYRRLRRRRVDEPAA